jgi:putative transposase
MGQRRYTAEQIIGKLRQAEVRAAEGKRIAEIVRELGVTEQTYYRWRREYEGLKVSQAKRLKRAGVPRSVAMKVTGHKTESTYTRYAIVDSIAMSEGLAKLAAMRADSDPIATFSATVEKTGTA